MGTRFLVCLVLCLGALLLPSAADAASPCGTFAPVGNTTLNVGQQGSYNIVAGAATFIATMDWGDGTQSSVSVSPSAPSATLTHIYTATGTFTVTLSTSGMLGNGTACSDTALSIATATIVAPAPPPPPLPPGPPGTPPPVGGGICQASDIRTAQAAQGVVPCQCNTGVLPAQLQTHCAPPPTNLLGGPLSTAQEAKTLKLVDKGTNVAGNSIGIVTTLAYLAGALGAAPEPVITKTTAAGLLAVAAFLKLYGSVVGFEGELLDPPDAHYQVVAAPARAGGPHVRSGHGLSSGVARAINAMSDNEAQLTAVSLALLTARDRSTGAAKAHNRAARLRQLRAAARYARTLATLIADGPTLQSRLARALRATHGKLSFSRAQLVRGQQLIASNGLPSPLVSALRAMGVSDAGIQQVRQQLVQQPVTGGVNIAHLLTNPALNQQTQKVASGFRALARWLAAGMPRSRR